MLVYSVKNNKFYYKSIWSTSHYMEF
jgi:hypothetical protein